MFLFVVIRVHPWFEIVRRFLLPEIETAEFRAARSHVFITVFAKDSVTELDCAMVTAILAGESFIRLNAGFHALNFGVKPVACNDHSLPG